ncbi:MAG: tail fiber domain-containing protein [Bacteroidales bacterium]|nr:tail fiber domain-containing protein [Bacteroidales bacterium]
MSDIRYKENIKNLQGATATLLKLRPVSFDFKANNNIFDTADLKGKVGFIAQEVQTILPNQVKYLSETDMYTLDYVSMIPYLVKAFQETYAENENLRDEVEELREAVELLKEQLSTPQNTPKNKAPKPGKSEKEAGAEATLYQNTPNPFSEKTIISYELPERVSSAKILIHSLDGQLIKTYSLSTTAGLGYISVDAGMLSPGMYTYSLSVNNRMVDTKRMVVTE